MSSGNSSRTCLATISSSNSTRSPWTYRSLTTKSTLNVSFGRYWGFLR